jgi:hypothetical protein
MMTVFEIPHKMHRYMPTFLLQCFSFNAGFSTVPIDVHARHGGEVNTGGKMIFVQSLQ